MRGPARPAAFVRDWRARTPAVAVVLCSVLLMTPVSSVFAGPRAMAQPGACRPNRPSDFAINRWAGWQVNGDGETIGGVYARIFNYAPYVDPGHRGDFVYTWTMLTVDHPLGTDAPYVQIGWVQFANGERHTMEQWKKVGEPPQTRFVDPPQPVNTYSYYDVLFNYRPGAFSFMVGGKDLHDDLRAWFTPTQAQIYAETLSLASQMPGGGDPSSHEDLLDSSYYMHGAWRSFMPGAVIHVNDLRGRDDSRYFGHTDPVSGGDLSVWDRACAR